MEGLGDFLGSSAYTIANGADRGKPHATLPDDSPEPSDNKGWRRKQKEVSASKGKVASGYRAVTRSKATRSSLGPGLRTEPLQPSVS